MINVCYFIRSTLLNDIFIWYDIMISCANIFNEYVSNVKSFMARSLPVENLLPQNVGSIINYLQ